MEETFANTTLSHFDWQIAFSHLPDLNAPSTPSKIEITNHTLRSFRNLPYSNLPTIGACQRHHLNHVANAAWRTENLIWNICISDRRDLNYEFKLLSLLGNWGLAHQVCRFTQLTNVCLTMSLTKLRLTTLVWRQRPSNFGDQQVQSSRCSLTTLAYRRSLRSFRLQTLGWKGSFGEFRLWLLEQGPSRRTFELLI